jgi:uncharacterized protein (TIGR00251 family)
MPGHADFSPALRDRGDGVTVDVWIVPGAARTEITGLHGTAVRIRVAAPPAGGRANRELVSFLRTVTGGTVELLRGQGSRRKRLLIRGVEAGHLAQRISEQTG